jgi:GSH-dependent disulfide-bond oxidoreductase
MPLLMRRAGIRSTPHFLAISPNNRIPAIVDRDAGLSLFESGAILLYLDEKSGRFAPSQGEASWRTLEWLMWQMGAIGPMLGQAHHFIRFNPGKAAYAEDRYGKEAKRLYGVLDRRLAEVEFMAGEYGIADMATFPWIARFGWQGIDLHDFPNVLRWYRVLAARPAVARGCKVPDASYDIPMP